METVADWYEKTDRLFVETHAFRECKEILDDRHWVTILGKPGDGKSMMAAHLMSQYRRKGFEPVFITSVQDCKNLLSCGQVKQFVVIDDMFGSTCLDRLKLNEWVSYMAIMEKIVEKGKGKLLVVCTSRKHIFEDANPALSKFRSFTTHRLLDMTSHAWKLTIDEKEEIFDKYAKEHNIVDHSAHDVARFEPPHGYPHCVVMFCSNIFLRKSGLDFFKNPTECIQKEIRSFRENDRIKYLVLILGLLFKNGLDINTIEMLCYEPDESITKLFKAAGVALDSALPDICSALDSLTSSYLRKDIYNRYHFTHECLLENVAAVFVSASPVLAIETIDFRILLTKINISKGVLSLKQLTTNQTVPAHEKLLESIIKRLTMELLKGNVYNAIMCDVWRDQNFVNGWVKYVSNMDENTVNKLFRPDINICGNLFEAFIQLGKAYVAKTILDNEPLLDKIYFADFLQQGLEIACAKDCSPILIKTILTHPVASPKKLKGSKLLLDALDKSNLEHAKVLMDYTEIDQTYVDCYGRGYLHKLFKTRIQHEDIDLFVTILKALLDSGVDRNAKDILGESPMDICSKDSEEILIGDEESSAFLIRSCLVRLGILPKRKIAPGPKRMQAQMRSAPDSDMSKYQIDHKLYQEVALCIEHRLDLEEVLACLQDFIQTDIEEDFCPVGRYLIHQSRFRRFLYDDLWLHFSEKHEWHFGSSINCTVCNCSDQDKCRFFRELLLDLYRFQKDIETEKYELSSCSCSSCLCIEHRRAFRWCLVAGINRYFPRHARKEVLRCLRAEVNECRLVSSEICFVCNLSDKDMR